MTRLKNGDAPDVILDDRFVEAFTIAGNVDDCRAQAAAHTAAGVTELALKFFGPSAAAQPTERNFNYFGLHPSLGVKSVAKSRPAGRGAHASWPRRSGDGVGAGARGERHDHLDRAVGSLGRGRN